MASLFFVYTPLQLYVVQEIIRQENLKENILLKGYIGNNVQCLEIFEYIKRSELWSGEYLKPNVGSWLDVDLYHPVDSMRRIRRDFADIQRIVDNRGVTSIYFGDINNRTAQIATQIFSKQGVKINFYEEGASHYHFTACGGVLSHKPLMARIYQILFDVVLYVPLFGERLGRWEFVEPMMLNEMPINHRFSIIPQWKETYDKQLIVSKNLSPKLKSIVGEECKDIDTENSILFLDQPIYEIVVGSKNIYFDTLKQYFCNIPKGTSIIIKYHPRETDEIKARFESFLRDMKISFTIISQKINLPVEFYMQQIHFKKVVNIFSSSSFYNGYLFDKVEFVYLIEDFYKNCKAANIAGYHNLDKTIALYKKQVVKCPPVS